MAIRRMDSVIGKWLPSGKEFELLDPFDYFIHPIHIQVPTGFVTDFASIPRFLWRIFPPWDKHISAAVVHDWLYRKGTLIDRSSGIVVCRQATRQEADAIFRRHMDQLGVPLWKCWMIYQGVSKFGWMAWKKNRKE